MQLLNRTTRHASATENGQAYFERALSILADLDAADQAVAQAQSTPRGLLRVNAPMSFGTLQLGPAIADFMAQCPELQIQLVLSDDQVDPMQGGFDVTLRIADLESSSLIARKIVAIDRAVCASPDYLKQHGTPKLPEDLRSHALPDLWLPAHGQSVEADRQGWQRSLDPAELDALRQQCGSTARCRDHGQGRRAAADLHCRRCIARGRSAQRAQYLQSTAADALCDLSADAAPCRKGAPVHRFPGGALQPACRVG